jgi:ABC-type lipoprotein release transport system permease subunit
VGLCETLVSWRLLAGGLSPWLSHRSYSTTSEEPPLSNFNSYWDIPLAAVLGLLGTAGIMRGVAAVSNLRPVISPSIYIAGVVIVVVAAALASLIPAMRATNLDPSSTLRAD